MSYKNLYGFSNDQIFLSTSAQFTLCEGGVLSLHVSPKVGVYVTSVRVATVPHSSRYYLCHL